MGPKYGGRGQKEQAKIIPYCKKGVAQVVARGKTVPIMKIGILSDTHNHLRETRRALDLLVQHGAQHLVHCGDVGDEVLDLLSAIFMEQDIRSHVALGNCDGRQGNDACFAPQPAGIECGLSPEFTLAGKTCIVLHGHHVTRLDSVMGSGQFDYVFTGHTHHPMNRQVGRTRILNPGSPVRPRGGPPTVLILDLDTGETSWIPV